MVAMSRYVVIHLTFYMLCLNTFRYVFMSLKMVAMSQYLVIRLKYYMLCLDTSRYVLCL